MKEYCVGSSDKRPWGSYTVTSVAVRDGEEICEKNITINSGGVLSLQAHRHRREHWQVRRGHLTAILDGKMIVLGPGESLDVPQGAVHAMANLNGGPCEIYERQEGICREEDIIRFADLYGRTPNKVNGEAASSINLYTKIIEQIRKNPLK